LRTTRNDCGSIAGGTAEANCHSKGYAISPLSLNAGVDSQLELCKKGRCLFPFFSVTFCELLSAILVVSFDAFPFSTAIWRRVE
jgi:hypothetical protein